MGKGHRKRALSPPQQCGQGAKCGQGAADEPGPDDASDFDICQRILTSINSPTPSPAPEELSLDSVLSSASFRSILCTMVPEHAHASVAIPVVTRAYEETFMREARPCERPCASGGLCECMFIDPTAPFVGVEFALPGEPSGPTPELCILCLRKVTQKLFYDMLFAKQPMHGLIQRHGNLCWVAWEYAEECTLICPPNRGLQCMPLPVMSHQRNRYVVLIHNNAKSLRQIHVGFEDFQPPSTSIQT